jgi:hypothetical protein
MIIHIATETFWERVKDIYPNHGDWHLLDCRIQKITKKQMGLQFIDAVFSDKSSSEFAFEFRVVNEKRYIFAKLKYGI